MQCFGKKRIIIFAGLSLLVFLTGCNSGWKKKFQSLDVEHQNLKGLYDNCRTTLEQASVEKSQLAQQVTSGQKTIEELQRQISERNRSAGDVTGFGDQYDVDLDAQAGTITVTLPNKILFASGKAALKQSSKADLAHIVSVLNERYSSKTIDVVGHTDSDPIRKSNWKDNWELSAQRSLSVLRYLNANGVTTNRLRAVGCGQGRPVASNKTASGKAQNRRVGIVVHMR